MFHLMPGNCPVFFHDMNRAVKVIAITDDQAAANTFMRINKNASVIACDGPIILLANATDKGYKLKTA